MGKLESFDNKQTKWEGLWWHPEYNGFSSTVIDLSVVRKFKGKVRLYVRKNKFYNGGENGRPNYCFSLKDADSEVFNTLEVVEDDDPLEELREVMREGNLNANQIMLASESQYRAQELTKRAIELVEKITGEEWNFTYITY